MLKTVGGMKLMALDYAAVLLCLLVIGGFSLFTYGGRGTPADVLVEASGVKWIYPLSVDRREAVPGPLGDTIVVISGGRVRVEDAPCPDKLCVHMPPASRPGQWIACLPNRVLVRVRGRSEQGVDIVSW